MKFNKHDFMLLENFTNSDRTAPYLDTYLQLFPNFGNSGKKLSDKNEPNDFGDCPTVRIA